MVRNGTVGQVHPIDSNIFVQEPSTGWTEWRASTCHPERQRRISRAGDRDPSLSLRMTGGESVRLFLSDELVEHYVGINGFVLACSSNHYIFSNLAKSILKRF